MSYYKFLSLGAVLLFSSFASSHAYAVNCSISYYCYRSMTPGPASTASNNILVRRTTQASERVAAAARREQARRVDTNAGAGQPPRVSAAMTLQQRQAEARRREQQQQRELAQRRQRATQEQQRLIAAQRRAYQQRLAQQRRNPVPGARVTTSRTQPAVRPVVPSAAQSCAVINKKVAELNRQAVLRSKEKQYDQAQRLFKAVAQLKREGKVQSCPGMS